MNLEEELSMVYDVDVLTGEASTATRLKPAEKYFKMRECCWDTLSAYEFCGLLLTDMWVKFESDSVAEVVDMFCLLIEKFNYIVDKANLKVFFLGKQLSMRDSVPKEAIEFNRIYIVDFVMNRYFILMLDLGAIKPQLIRYNIEAAQPHAYYS